MSGGSSTTGDKTDTGKAALAPPRVIRPNRSQPIWDNVDPETWLQADDVVRSIWAFVVSADLTALYDRIKARGSGPGRSAADPAVLLSLWLRATIDGVGAAREVERLANCQLAYMWLRHGVPVNYHGLADFRLAHADVLDDLLTQHLAALTAAGVVNTDDIIVDGTKVAASAGRDTLRRRRTLTEIEAEARTRVAALKAEVEADPAAADNRRQAARVRAARETAKRACLALEKLKEIEAERAQRAKTSPKEVARLSGSLVISRIRAGWRVLAAVVWAVPATPRWL